MQKLTKSRTLYPHPFSKAYWRDAAMELKDTKMLVFAALMIAVRVAMKGLAIPLAPGLKINTAFVANALGAMVYGPVMAGLCAAVSDVLGYIVWPQDGVYFLPFILTEIAGSVFFALFLYRAKVSPTRVMFSRFCICFVVNVLIQTPIMIWYYSIYFPGRTYVLTIPGIIKNLFMFPIESVVLTLFLSVMVPITNRMGLTYSGSGNLKFSKKQIALLVLLFVLGSASVLSYLNYYCATTSLTASYSKEERPDRNKDMLEYVRTGSNEFDNVATVTIAEKAMRPFMSHEITYTVGVYAPIDSITPEALDKAWAQSKSKAAKNENLTRVATATFVVNEKTDEVLSFELTPAE